jgi:DNA-binding response OmpR family regulator
MRVRDEDMPERGHFLGKPYEPRERARSLIATEPIDAAVLDIHLAGELVFPAAEALDERRIPFLFMSGFDRSVVPVRFAHVQLLEKPVSFDALLQAMTVLLGG